jgi:Na+/proline symporter
MSYVALSKLLLPAGLMGILFASMFAATMSTLNGEFNIMAGVLTNDVYKRLIHPEAKEKHLLWVARISVILIGGIVILGGIYIDKFGGAFEANKLFTGIFAIPAGFPLLFGIIFKKPNSKAAIATILIGAASGIVLNAIHTIPWEWATLIEILICTATYFIPGFFLKRSDEHKKNVDLFFKTMNTPIKESDKPSISFEYKQSMVYIFIFAFIVSGILFMSMSFFSFHLLSGKLGVLASIICLAGAIILWIYYKKIILKHKNR